jgi:hypothetical protein
MKIYRVPIVFAIIVFALTSVFAGFVEPVVEKNPALAKAEETPGPVIGSEIRF